MHNIFLLLLNDKIFYLKGTTQVDFETDVKECLIAKH